MGCMRCTQTCIRWADFVIYPTRWEGFGNQLIEAFAARLPTIVFEYPVYKEDIGPKGFRVVSLADKILPETGRRGACPDSKPDLDSGGD